ncbi:MAG: hypothetical protein ACRD1J_12075, partial [Terriglobia bacterium]
MIVARIKPVLESAARLLLLGWGLAACLYSQSLASPLGPAAQQGFDLWLTKTHDLPLFTPLPVAQIPRVFRLSLCACPEGSGSSDCRYFAAEEMAGNPALLASKDSWTGKLRGAGEPWDSRLNAWDQSESAAPSKHASIQNGSPGHIFWVFPAYKVDYLKNVKPLTPREKFKEWARAAYDPLGLGAGAVEAVLEHSPRDGFCGYGNGWGGYGKCFASAELDANVSSFFGDYLFPVLLHQDPRY